MLADGLYLGDCIEIMKNIDDKSIDCILCDLPYGTTRNKWDIMISLDVLWGGYHRIIKDNGAIILFSQMPFTAELVRSNLEWFRYEWIWEKDNGTGFLNALKMPMKVHENICVFYLNPPTYNPQMRTGFKPYSVNQGRQSSNYGKYTEGHLTVSNGERYPIDIIHFNSERGLHPTQKPILLLEYLIKTYTNEGDLVLDNCMGSGSTCVACKHTNRRYIGIEKDEKYFKIAKERVDGAHKEVRLF